jgi:hypothetical protein
MNLKCQECEKAGQKCRIYIGGCIATSMYCPSIYDEDGKHYVHDFNNVTQQLSCSNGHSWVEAQEKSCPSCDWKG